MLGKRDDPRPLSRPSRSHRLTAGGHPWLIFLLSWAAPAAGEVVTDRLSVTGNADVFARHVEGATNVQLSQYQVDLDYRYAAADRAPDAPATGALPARSGDSYLYSHVELEGRGGDVFQSDATDKNQFRIEGAFFGYHTAAGVDFRFGRFISPSGYEGAEPWRRFTRITAFGGIFAYLQNGVGVRYSTPTLSAPGGDLTLHAYAAFIDGAWTGDTDLEDPSFEALLGFDWGKLFVRSDFAYERSDNVAPALRNQDRTLWNTWAEYSLGPVTVAAEYDRMDEISALPGGLWQGQAYLVFGKVAIGPHAAFGVRYSRARYEDIEGNERFDSSEVTLTPRWQIYDANVDPLAWDFRGDVRFQHDVDAIQGFEDGVVLEVGSTLRY